MSPQEEVAKKYANKKVTLNGGKTTHKGKTEGIVVGYVAHEDVVLISFGDNDGYQVDATDNPPNAYKGRTTVYLCAPVPDWVYGVRSRYIDGPVAVAVDPMPVGVGEPVKGHAPSFKQREIPPFPHKCPKCGQAALILFTSIECTARCGVR